jgi:3-oxoacyl-[acyl-carrier protein] reductase
MRLEDVKAIVTGAASGLGRHFTLELLRAGARVAAGDLNDEGLASLAGEARELPGRLVTRPLDVSREESVEAFVDAIAGPLAGINTLVNNAGILRDGLLVTEEDGFVRKLPVAQWKRVLEVNLTGPFLMAREVVARMVEAGVDEGVIVNISSVTRAGNPGQSNYAAAKAGLDADTRTWALELARHRIRVGGIAPGVIDTPILERITPEALAALRAAIPLGRVGRPHEVWLALKFIIECEFFTGRTVEVDGGASA